MGEIGIDVSYAKAQKPTEQLAKETQFLITMGGGDKSLTFPACAAMIGLCVIRMDRPQKRSG